LDKKIPRAAYSAVVAYGYEGWISSGSFIFIII